MMLLKQLCMSVNELTLRIQMNCLRRSRQTHPNCVFNIVICNTGTRRLRHPFL
jgi:hypothetical protein